MRTTRTRSTTIDACLSGRFHAGYNKQLVRRVIEHAINNGNLSIADDLIAADYVYHEATAGEKRGRDGFRHLIITYHTAFPNVRVSVDQQIAEGDWVATRWSATRPQPYTNQHVTVRGILISRISDGRIAEEFECYDALGMLRQLGTVKAWGIAA